ncbi:MAG: aldo/keto reductase [Actinomycetota bacterium]|nr:aldo/keto reductase [Actinomycetota bacterium]
MQTRKLGSHGPEITTLGFGSWAVGGAYKFGWGPTDDDESVAAIRHALDAGVNWVDSAAVYGLGHSEKIVGRAIEDRKPGEDVFVFTKCGGFYREELGKVEYDLRPESIRRECEDSLGRLGIDRIDLYQIHWPDNSTGTPIEESWKTMAELVDEGKVRWAGVSNFAVEMLDKCETVRHVDSVQPPLNLIKRAARQDVIPWAKAHGTGVLAYAPMSSGLLTGKYDRHTLDSLAPDDWRRNSAAFKEPELSGNLALVGELGDIARAHGLPLPVLAVAWALAIPGVTGAIVGARRPDQVDGWLEAGSVELDSAVIEEIEGAVRRSGAGSG